MKKILFFLGCIMSACAIVSCGDDDWLKVKRPKFDQETESGSRKDTTEVAVEEDGQLPEVVIVGDEVPEVIIAVEEEEV